MKRVAIFLISLLAGLLLLTACERPAQEAPAGLDTVDPNSALLPSDKPADVLELPLEGTATVDPALEGGAAGAEGTPTVEPTATPEAAEVIPTEIIHEVVSGDTLMAISERYGISVAAIVAANNLPDPDVLEVGQKLIIPSSEDAVINAEGETGASTDATATERIHIVSSGETLYRIGLVYGFTVEELAAYNALTNPDRLEIGQQIRIPPSQ